MKVTKAWILIALLLIPAITVHAWPIPKTGQTKCYNNTAEITCPGPGDLFFGQDGNIQAGLSWPTPRFTDSSNGTLIDNLTGLIWVKNANVMADRDPSFDNDGTAGDGAVTWDHALDYVKKLNQENYLGYNDWRLPNRNERESLTNAEYNDAPWLQSVGFINVKDYNYWTSSTGANLRSYAWLFGTTSVSDLKTHFYYVHPVRSGSLGTVTVLQTGQTTCWDSSGIVISCAGTGQDGDLQTGAAWPSPRFINNGNETIKDNLTGLTWTSQANAPGPAACSPGTSKTWQNALSHITCLNNNNYKGFSDWRLPNRKELLSLVNLEASDHIGWLSSSGFTDLPGGSVGYYWISTTASLNVSTAWIIEMLYPALNNNAIKASQSFRVWPVRSEATGVQVIPVSLNFGDVPKGSTKDFTLTVKNTGGGTLTGNATTTAPFSIVSDGSYSLGHSQIKVINIRYQSTSSGTHTGSVIFTGGNGIATVPVTAKTPSTKNPSPTPWLMLLFGD